MPILALFLVGGSLAKRLIRWTASWICSALSRAQILGQACKIANWFPSYSLGFMTMFLCSI